MNTNTFSNLTLAQLRPALTAVGAYNKVARYNAPELRAYADKVAEVRASGNVEPVTAENVDALLSTVRADAEARRAEAVAFKARCEAEAAAAKPAPVAVKAVKAPKAVKAVKAPVEAAPACAADMCWTVLVTLTSANVKAILALWPSLKGSVKAGQIVCLRTTRSMEAAAAHCKNSELQDYDAWTSGAIMEVGHGTVEAATAMAMPHPEGWSKTALVRAARAARAAAKLA